jgi:hypothetical protein
MRLAAVIVAIAAIAGAQGLTGTVQNATDVVVADIISGAGLDELQRWLSTAGWQTIQKLLGELARGSGSTPR